MSNGSSQAGLPALQALLIQILSFLITAALAWLVSASGALRLTAMSAALLQGVLAALISRRRRMAPWWPPIQLVFPVSLISLLALHWPSWIFLAAFLVLAALFWTTFRTQVPYFPSGPIAWSAVAAQLPQGRPIAFVDIGSGFGGLVLHLARLRPESAFVGVEVAPLPWFASRLRARLSGSRARFSRRDYQALDLGSYDVVFAYLSPAAMPALWRKAAREMGRGALLLSYEFLIPEAPPLIVIHPPGGGPALYGWRIGCAESPGAKATAP